MATDIDKAPEALQQLVADSDTGGRKPQGLTRHIIFAVALVWALFQYWYASPLPFALGWGILNDTEARAIHLAFALFLSFAAWPAFKRSPRDRVPAIDWLLAGLAAFAGAYIMLFYAQLATRPGQPTQRGEAFARLRQPVVVDCVEAAAHGQDVFALQPVVLGCHDQIETARVDARVENLHAATAAAGLAQEPRGERGLAPAAHGQIGQRPTQSRGERRPEGLRRSGQEARGSPSPRRARGKAQHLDLARQSRGQRQRLVLVACRAVAHDPRAARSMRGHPVHAPPQPRTGSERGIGSAARGELGRESR